VGSLFPTASHPGQEPLGLVRLREIRQVIPSNIQLVAVGGIRLENIHKVRYEPYLCDSSFFILVVS
jgi:thiamine monophosphate synthase